MFKRTREQQEQTTQSKKQALKDAFSTGTRVDPQLRREGTALLKSLQYDEHQTESINVARDDEYSNAGVQDPKIVITTSRSPSTRLAQFAKEVKLLFPNSQRLNRGNYVISELVAACKSNQVSDLILLHEHRGVPDTLIVSHFPYGPTAFFSLHNVVLRHDMPDVGTVSEAFPHLVMHNFTTKLGERTKNILKYLFPVPKPDSKRVITFSNNNDFISFRHHVYRNNAAKIELAEMGPRFEMKLFQIKQGTVDVEEADVEWILHSFTNTAKKKNNL